MQIAIASEALELLPIPPGEFLMGSDNLLFSETPVWHSDYGGAPLDGSARMEGADRQPRRCLRGGAWDMNAFRCRSTYRSFDFGDLGTKKFGFRVATDREPDATPQ